MDRFIVINLLKIIVVIIYLKSNMDRFIGGEPHAQPQTQHNLKSNMDRFIEHTNYLFKSKCIDLKSNMDRFIAV